MIITPYQIAERFTGLEEVPGREDNPAILAMLKLDANWPEGDEVPWCSAFVNYVAFLMRLPRSKSLRARSWLRVGLPITLGECRPDSDVVILSRGTGVQPGPDVINAPGHVGFYSSRSPDRGEGLTDDWVYLLGGNQGDEVSVARYSAQRVLGIRRLDYAN